MKRLTIWMWAAMMLCIIATSCSRQPELLRTIPASAQVVGCFDLPRLAAQCGVNFENSTPFSDRTVRSLGELAPVFLAANACGDLSQTYMFVTTGGSTFVTFMLKDREAFEKALTTSLHLTPVQNQGYKLYELRSANTSTVVLRDNQAWIISYPTTLEDLRAALDAAADADMASVNGVADRLKDGITDGGDITMVINTEATRGSDRSQWLMVKTDVDSVSIKCDVRMINADGKDVKYAGVLPMDVAALRHIPSSSFVLAGAGINGRDVDWEMFINPLTIMGGFRARGLYDTLAPYLKALDGTMIVSASPANGNKGDVSDPETWKLTLLAHMSQAAVDQACATLVNQLSMPGVDIQKDSDGTTVLKFGDTRMYVANLDGYFAVSNQPFGNYTPDTAVASLCNDAVGVVVVDLPSLGVFGHTMPRWGVRLEGRYDDTHGEFTLSLPGSDGPVFQSLLELY